MTKQTSRGFTLIELLVVISIIGLLSSVVMSSVNTARKRADDTQRNQIAEEYRKAIMLSYDTDGGYPFPGTTGTVYCLGDYAPTGVGNYSTLDVCGGSLTGTYGVDEDPTLEAAVARFVPSLPVMKTIAFTLSGNSYTYKAPIYMCTADDGVKCTSAFIRWRIGQPNHKCIKGATLNHLSPDSTLCTLYLD
ncbi:MAG: hypothetical protein A2481_04015 [Candidatus Yonathbacteria bacterium RIFOXYC2_FULL_47_9]|nr:MAG: hypothetical protein A2481_04015 [Candidatus Yonathbacteria bacterium RIFOXYC2_FULL_47_9]HAT68213.1 hypothetical protein [Candidatus Yonathbacteria bacterium]